MFIVNESNEKVKLRETERNLEQLEISLENEKKVNSELCIVREKYRAELDTINKELAAIQTENTTLQNNQAKRKEESEKIKKEYRQQAEMLKELKDLYSKEKDENGRSKKKLKNAENLISSLKEHQSEELEFTKSQLTLVENKCSSLTQQISDIKKEESKKLSATQDDFTKKTAALQTRTQNLEQKCKELQNKITDLCAENELLKSKLVKSSDKEENVKVTKLEKTAKVSVVPHSSGVASPLIRSMSSLNIAPPAAANHTEPSTPLNSNMVPKSDHMKRPQRVETRSLQVNKRSLETGK